MKKQILYIHGGASYSNRDDFLQHLKTAEVRNPHGIKTDWWSAFLQNSLGESYEVFSPKMPNSDNSRYDEWKIWFERHFAYIQDEAALVGWSQGAFFLQKYLLENTCPFNVKGLVLVAPPVFYFKNDHNGEDGHDFNFDIENLSKLAEVTPNITVFHSKDDFVVPYEHAQKFMELVPSAKLVSFEDRNHFLQPEFPELVEHIKNLG